MNPVAYTTPEELQYLELEKTAFIYKELFRETAIPLYTLAQVKAMVAQEREECAKLSDETNRVACDDPYKYRHPWEVAEDCGASIRARGDE